MAKITLLLSFSNCATSRRSHNDAESEKSWQVWNYESIRIYLLSPQKGWKYRQFPLFFEHHYNAIVHTFWILVILHLKSFPIVFSQSFFYTSGNVLHLSRRKKIFFDHLPNGNTSCSVASRSVYADGWVKRIAAKIARPVSLLHFTSIYFISNYYIVQGVFCNCSAQISVQKEKRCSTNEDLLNIVNFMKQNLWHLIGCPSFFHFGTENWEEQLKKHPVVTL